VDTLRWVYSHFYIPLLKTVGLKAGSRARSKGRVRAGGKRARLEGVKMRDLCSDENILIPACVKVSMQVVILSLDFPTCYHW